jgi:hypothetical protein
MRIFMNGLTESLALLKHLKMSQKLVLLRIFIVINASAYFIATWMPFHSLVVNILSMIVVYALMGAFMFWLGVMRGIGFHRKTLQASGSPVITVQKPSLMSWYIGVTLTSFLLCLVAALIVANMSDAPDLTGEELCLFLVAEAVVMGVALLLGLRKGWHAVMVDATTSVAPGAPMSPGQNGQAGKGGKSVKVGLAIVLGVVVLGGAIAALNYQNSNATSDDDLHAPIDNSPADGNPSPVASSTPSQDISVSSAIAPTATTPPSPANTPTPYPNGMAQNFSQCGKPGYDSDNLVCHPVGQPIAEQSSDTAGLPPAINAINDQLAKLGTLSVTMTNPQGYPVFSMECNPQGQCVNGVGVPMGTLQDIAQEMTTVRQSDITRYDYKCSVICIDAEGNIIGRPETSL